MELSEADAILKSIFQKNVKKEENGLDQNGLDKNGLTSFWQELGVFLDKETGVMVYLAMVPDLQGHVTLPKIYNYLISAALKRNTEETTSGVLQGLLDAETEGRCPMKAKALIEYLRQMQSDVLRRELKAQLKKAGADELMNCVELADVQEEEACLCVAAGNAPRRSLSLNFAAQDFLDESKIEDAKQLAELFVKLQKKGKTGLEQMPPSAFTDLKRVGQNQEVVMQDEGSLMSPVAVGVHSLTDLFSKLNVNSNDSPPQHLSVQAKWDAKNGKLRFSDDFDRVIPTEIATPPRLKYYGCSLANVDNDKVAMLYPGYIHHFNYSADYVDNYIKTDCGGGASLERHPFPHLDSPDERKCGILVIGKYTDDHEENLHLTGFVVPTGQMVYIPPNVIHTNNYLKGTWVTMLSEPDDVASDQVRMVKGGKMEPFAFSFAPLVC